MGANAIAENLWTAIDAARADVRPVAPAGAVTCRDYMKHYGMSETAAKRELYRLVALGVFEATEATINGHRTKVYMLKQGAGRKAK